MTIAAERRLPEIEPSLIEQSGTQLQLVLKAASGLLEPASVDELELNAAQSMVDWLIGAMKQRRAPSPE
jgi:hypothetical protein